MMISNQIKGLIYPYKIFSATLIFLLSPTYQVTEFVRIEESFVVRI